METLGAIVVLAAIVGALLLWNKVKDGMQVKITRTVLGRDHKAGQALVGQRMEFVTASTTGATLGAIRRRVGAPEQPPAVVAGLYLAHASGSSLTYAIGSKLATGATAVVSVAPNEAGGCRGMFKIEKWTEVDGIVGGLPHLQRLAEAVQVAVRELDAEAGITLSDAAG